MTYIEREAEMLFGGGFPVSGYQRRVSGLKRNGNGNGRTDYASLRQVESMRFRGVLNKDDVKVIHDMNCIRTPEAGIEIKCGVKVEPGVIQFYNRRTDMPVATVDTSKNIATICHDNLSMPEICEVESRLEKVYHLDRRYFGTA